MKMRPILLRVTIAFSVASAFLFGCSLINTFELREDTIETCTNGKDDDGDGLKNCFDPECVVLAKDLLEKEGWSVQDVIDRGLVSCLEVTDELCRDGIDNDMDGIIDCKELDCIGLPSCLEVTDEQCQDGIDNDMDGFIDCLDFDCKQQPSCQAISKENDPVACGDEIDNDGDDSIDCADPDCHSVSLEVCDPSEYSDIKFEDDFSLPVEENINWDIYDFTTIDIRDSEVSEIDSEWHIMASTSTAPTYLFREEKGIYSKKIFDLWGNITDVVVDLRVTDTEAHTPVIVGLAIDSTGDKPFLEKLSSDGSEPMGRKAILALLVDGLGRMQLCARKLDNEPLLCSPESGPREPVDAFTPGAGASYRISIDDSLVNVYQQVGENPQQLMLSIPNPYDPGIARLFLVASTDKSGEQGKSEMFVDEIQVYQVAPPSYPQVAYQMENGSDPGWTSTGNNESCSYNAGENAMEVSWSGRSDDTCSVFVGPSISEGRFQTTYRFMVAGLGPEAYFLPGLWDPLMNFNDGMAFTAGVYARQDAYMHYFFVFRPCSSSNPDDNNKEYWESLEGVSLRSTAGHYPEKNFSYVLFQDAGADKDIVSYVKYDTACFNLTQFGFTTKYAPATSVEASVRGVINEVRVTEYAKPGEIQYGP